MVVLRAHSASGEQSGQGSFDRAAHQRHLAEEIKEEIIHGRLFGGLKLRNISFDRESTLTLREFVDLIISSTTVTGQSALREAVLRRLHDALQHKNIDSEVCTLLVRLSARELQVIRSRYDLTSRKTLQALADDMAITRERVRQIQSKAEGRLISPSAPSLRIRSGIHFVAPDASTLGVRGIAKELLRRRLLENEAHLADFLLIWEATNLEIAFPREAFAISRPGITPKQARIAKRIRQRSAKLNRNCGAFRPSWCDDPAEQPDLIAALRSLGYREIRPG